ncbi:calcium/proton exchanger [bacterium]|nr:calcium/proton exchanger [bacterium]
MVASAGAWALVWGPGHGWPNELRFLVACGAIIPLAGGMGKATEDLANRCGEALGGFLNATFGNAAELIIGILALKRGLILLVKASLVGSILGNLLLVFGAALLAGGWKRKEQVFNLQAATASSALLVLAVAGLALPSLERMTQGEAHVGFSTAAAYILLGAYGLSLLFSLRTHTHLYTHNCPEEMIDTKTTRTALVGRLAAFAVLIGLYAEVLVGAVEGVADSWGWGEVFVGVVIVAIVGNAAEHASAVMVAMKNRMDLSLHIAAGSTTQIALFVAPALVLVGHAMGQPMDLVFSPLEVVAVALSVAGFSLIVQDGRSNWFEGTLLLSLYALLGVAFWFA